MRETCTHGKGLDRRAAPLASGKRCASSLYDTVDDKLLCQMRRAEHRQALNLAVMAETASAPKEGGAWAASAFALELPPHSSPHAGPLTR